MVALNRSTHFSEKYRPVLPSEEGNESSDGDDHAASISLSQEKCNESLESSTIREYFSHLCILLVGIVVGLASSRYFLEMKYTSSYRTVSNDYRRSYEELQQRYTSSLQKLENKLFEAKSSSSSCDEDSKQLRKQLLQFTNLEKKYNLMKNEQSQVIEEKDRVANELILAKRSMNKYESQIQLLIENRRKNEEELKHTKELKGRIKVQDHQMQKLRQNYTLWENEVQRLQSAISMSSLRSLRQRYGEGPHRVNFQVIYSFGNSRVTKSFIVELAPNHMMPHSALTFLDMVSSNFYDGYAFTYSADHVIIVSESDAEINPFVNHRTINTSHDNPFVNQRTVNMLHGNPLIFQEYNPKFPHKEMTLGFFGKKLGGPAFYISKQDNSDAHAFDPSLKDEHGFPQKPGEPCFAKIIQGVETIQEIDHLLLSNQRANKQQVRVEIQSANILH